MIRPMQASDIARVAEIHVFARRKAYRGIISDKNLFIENTVVKRIEYFDSILMDDDAKAYVFDDGIVKGFVTIGLCNDDDKPGSLLLRKIYIDPFMQGCGIGTQLADYCEKVAGQMGINEICLWVLEKNLSARGFYEKLGYLSDGAKRYFENGSCPTQLRYCKGVALPKEAPK